MNWYEIINRLVLSLVWAVVVASPVSAEEPRDAVTDVHLNPHQVLGAESCQKCHAAEVGVWKLTPHHTTFMTLHRNPAAQEIADRLGIQSFKNDANCIKCHYTMQADAHHNLQAISGISCESCHGAAEKWIEVHNDFGGPRATRQTESPQHRLARLRASIGGGMRNPVNVYLIAQSCYRCHTVPDERLVNVGGHNAGSMDFEFVAWSQGTLRHNFSRTQGQSNDPSSRDRLRQMFMAGMIADLEFSIRATAAATEKADFGVNAARRAARAAKRLAAAQSKLRQPLLDEVLGVFGSVELKMNHRQPLMQAADQINFLGIRFAASVPGNELEAIDPFIPAQDKWK
ncbi:MAG: cytochrome c family protein [Pirellulaceae bacterium]|nr:cytochrome c family protein [Pirellulaceae bacterium]